MSHTIDVLAVLATLNLASPDQRTSLTRTRAAVAELIEAAADAAELLERVAPYNPQAANLLAALARCRGGDA